MHAENEVAGAPTGGMDQSAALLCRQGRALLLDCRDGATEQVPFDLAASGHVLLVTDTRASHALADGQYGNRRAECERAAATLGVASLREVDPGDLDAALRHLGDPVLVRRTRHVVTETARVRAVVAALRDDDLATVGRHFDASHESLRRDYEVSCPELDASVEAAREAGALGARMTGGGFGGSSIAIVPEDGVERVRRAIRDAFGFMGGREPRSIEVPASGPARRAA